MLSATRNKPETAKTKTKGSEANNISDLRHPGLNRLRSRWYEYAEQAHKLNKQGQHRECIKLFERCIDISLNLITADKYSTTNAVSLYYYSSHNLAACYNQIQKAKQGETLLRNVYEFIVLVCQNKALPRELRLDALASLDKSLFSLSAQLAYMGKTAGIHPLIRETEKIAETCMMELWGVMGTEGLNFNQCRPSALHIA